MPGVDAALELARMGFAVFPLAERTKNPLKDSHGFYDATTDTDTIHQLFGTKPYNVGIATGAVSGNIGVIDIDIAADGSYDGNDTLNDWQTEHGKLPETASVVTGRGGTHLYYRFPNGTPRLYKNNDLHVDFRGEGGYVMAPGSIHPNGNEVFWDVDPYEWPIADADENVIAFVEAHRPDSGIGASDSAKKGKPLVLPEKLKEGARDETLFRYAASERARGVPEDVALVAARAYNQNHCSEPLDDRTVVQKVRSAYSRYQPSFDIGEGITGTLKRNSISDRLLADLFAESVSAVRYCSEWKSFVTYNGKYWQIEGGKQLVERCVRNYIVYLQRHVGKILYDEGEKLTENEKSHLKTVYGSLCAYDKQQKRKNLVADISSEYGILCMASEFDSNKQLLNVENGTLDLSSTPVFRPHNPADMITRIAPVTYDPDATCPLFERVVAEAFEGDADLVRYFQKWCGIIVAGVTKLDKFLICGLANRASKDTILGTLLNLLGWKEERGSYACVVRPESLAVSTRTNSHGASSDIARWKGKRLILTTEFNNAAKLDVELIKTITGGVTPITARRLHENEQSFLIDGIVVMLANVWPSVEDNTLFDGDRPVCFPFEHHLEPWEIDTSIRERLLDADELSGVLNWCLDGLKAYYSEGLEPTPDAVREKLAEFREQSDPLTKAVSDFIQRHLVRREDAYTTVDAMYKLFDGESYQMKGIKKSDFGDRVPMFVQVYARKMMPDGKKPRHVIPGYALIE